MLNLLKPSLYVRSVSFIPLHQLQQQGIRGLIIDLDNTIAEWNKDEIQPDVAEWLSNLECYKMRACLVSNNSEERVKRVADALGIPCVYNAGKPRRRAFLRAMALLNTMPGQTAVVGDQIFTDILGGNRMGLYTILVVPISRREFILTRLVRYLERLFLHYLRCTEGSVD